MAITWRNVESSNPTVSLYGMRDAQQSMNSGFQGLQDVLKQYQDQEKVIWEKGKENNYQSFLDRLAQYKTPEELAAAQASGELEAFKQQFGDQIDRGLVRDAEAGMQQKLIERITAQNQYADSERDRKEAPIKDMLLGRLYSGDQEGFYQGLNEHELRNEGDLFKQGYEHKKDVRGEQRKDTRLTFEGRRVAAMEANSKQTRDIRATEHGWQLDARNAEILANKVIQQGGSFADVRSQVQQALPNVPISVLNTVLSNAQTNYTALTGRTPEQDEEMALKLAPYEAEVASAQQYLDSKPIFSQAINENMSESDAIGKVTELTPGEQDNTADMFRRAIKVLRRNKDLNIPEDANLGPVILAAAKMAGIDEGLFGDDHFNASDLEKVLPLAYKEYAEYMKYQEAFKGAEKKLNKARQLETDTYKIRNALKPSAK